MRRSSTVPLLVALACLWGTALLADGYALHFNGSTNYAWAPDSASLDVSSGLTIEAWVRSSSTVGAHAIVSKWNDDTDQWSYIFKDHNQLDTQRIELSSGGHSDLADLHGNASIVTNEWVHLAATYDSSTVRLYYNGVLDGTLSAPGAIHDSNALFMVGGVTGSSGLESFDGLIDEVRVWNYARSEEDIQRWMRVALPSRKAGLVAYYTFDEGYGQIARDLSGFGNDLTLGHFALEDNADPTWVDSAAPIGTGQTLPSSTAPVPEPATIVLLGLGVLGGLLAKRRRRG